MTQSVFYKVCSFNHSTFAWFDWAVEYQLNKFVVPKKANTKLFVFDTLTNAKRYADSLIERHITSEVSIYECEVVNPEYPVFKVAASQGSFKQFWKNKEDVISVRTPQPGTVLCNAVRLIKKVK